MPGIDTNRVVGKDAEELEEYTCSVCQGVFNDPKVTPCRHTFCKECIDEWLKTSKTCPIDRKPVTKTKLIDASLVVVNLIEKMNIQCFFREKGCPSVHTIGRDAEHLKLCQYSKCRECGLESPDSGHNCVNHLLSVNIELNKDRDKLKRKIARVERKNRDLKTSELLVTNENKKLKNDVVALAEMNDRLKRELNTNRILAVKMAIIKAKGKAGSVDKRLKLTHTREQIFLDICKSAIDGFDHTLETSKEFVDNIKARCDRQTLPSKRHFEWRVSVYPSHEQADSDASVDRFIRLSFGRLVIVISRH